jgi:hypothetical protein
MRVSRSLAQIPRRQYDNYHDHVVFIIPSGGPLHLARKYQGIPSLICCKRPPRGVTSWHRRQNNTDAVSPTHILAFVATASPRLRITMNNTPCVFNTHATVSRGLRLMRRSTMVLDVRSLASVSRITSL